MNFSKQNHVLEEIFEYLIDNGRKDLVDKFNDIVKPKKTEKICTARKNWKCCKCLKTIIKGAKYFNQTYIVNGMYVTKHYCILCSKSNEKKIKKEQTKFKFIV